MKRMGNFIWHSRFLPDPCTCYLSESLNLWLVSTIHPLLYQAQDPLAPPEHNQWVPQPELLHHRRLLLSSVELMHLQLRTQNVHSIWDSIGCSEIIVRVMTDLRKKKKVKWRNIGSCLTIVLLVFILLRSGRINKTAKGSDFPTKSLFVKSLPCTSFTSNVPTGFNSRSLKQEVNINNCSSIRNPKCYSLVWINWMLSGIATL